MEKLVIATRESPLALWQANYVRDLLVGHFPKLHVELLGMTTEGDRELGQSLAKIGGKGLFIKELEASMLDGRAHLAVHSMKDVPVQLPPGFCLPAILARDEARDAFVSNAYKNLSDLPSGAVVGTSSLRRSSQLVAQFPHLAFKPLRGNLQTRLGKLDGGHFDAIILAAAGLKRLGLSQRITAYLSIEHCIPAVGQGALGIECLSDNSDVIELVSQLNDPNIQFCVDLERAFSLRLSGSCTTPLGAYAELTQQGLSFDAILATPDGSKLLKESGSCGTDKVAAFGLIDSLVRKMYDSGAQEILDSLA
ncbi:MAG: hydroxymethylbilane synthase [Betaproteobacteria bacterium]